MNTKGAEMETRGAGGPRPASHDLLDIWLGEGFPRDLMQKIRTRHAPVQWEESTKERGRNTHPKSRTWVGDLCSVLELTSIFLIRFFFSL